MGLDGEVLGQSLFWQLHNTFVLTQIRVGGQQARHQDIQLGLRHNLIGQETTGIGGMATFEEQHSRLVEKGARGVSPMFIPMMIGDMASGLVSIRYGFRGANY